MKYICPECAEQFELVESPEAAKISCPRCGKADLEPIEACSREISPPPWEFRCLDCRSRFAVQSPSGPEEVAALSCPVCRSHKIKWLALSAAACATGG